MKIELKDYRQTKMYKIDSVTTGINIARRHKVFVESNRINLSALVRALLEELMADQETTLKGVKNKV